jgi:hypothetical protein
MSSMSRLYPTTFIGWAYARMSIRIEGCYQAFDAQIILTVFAIIAPIVGIK